MQRKMPLSLSLFSSLPLLYQHKSIGAVDLKPSCTAFQILEWVELNSIAQGIYTRYEKCVQLLSRTQWGDDFHLLPAVRSSRGSSIQSIMDCRGFNSRDFPFSLSRPITCIKEWRWSFSELRMRDSSLFHPFFTKKKKKKKRISFKKCVSAMMCPQSLAKMEKITFW